MVGMLQTMDAHAVTLYHVPFSELHGWSDAQAIAGLQAFKQSCKKTRTQPLKAYGTNVSRETWQSICNTARTVVSAEAKAFFEATFEVMRVHDGTAQSGLLTGYYTPTLHGSMKKSPAYPIPLYMKPNESLRTRYSRAEIENGALEGKGLELLWISNAIDVFFLHIQGSGYVKLDDGQTHKLVFAGKNDFPYTAIGRQFVADGVVAAEDMSMQWLRKWLEAHPDKANRVMQRNESFIFFSIAREQDAVTGAEGTTLTPQHSVAIDPAYVGYGTLLYLQTHLPDGKEFNALSVAQDTGSAIRGALRADLYTGVGDNAGALAGRLKSDAIFYMLLPKARHDSHR